MKPDLLSVLENHHQFQKNNTVRVLRQSVRLITSEIGRNLIRNGYQNLSARHLSVFENLSTSDNNIVTLANRAGISKQAMSKLVKEISAEGYVKVVTDQRDSRVQIVMLTEQGANFLLFLEKEICDRYNDILEAKVATKEDFTQLRETLKSVHTFLDTKPFDKESK